MRGDPELHEDGSLAVEASDHTGSRYEVRVRAMDQMSSSGLVPWNPPPGLTGRLLHRLLGPPQPLRACSGIWLLPCRWKVTFPNKPGPRSSTRARSPRR